MKVFSEKLKELRERKGWSMSQLAKQLGCSNSSVSVWERGLFSPDVLVAADLADIFGCSINELVGRPRPCLDNIQQKPVGEIIREKRKQRGITIGSLEFLTGWHHETIRSWEKGEMYPSILNATILADLFNCSVDELVGRKVKK